ncbi:putative multicopper oxidase, type 1 [Teratosphaeria nubilosa]|uniref:laccase n=1 Tax=Teratosphaeria nubilosa TaxID=161662 RepID=A0A6G1KZH5_9PEZI|nr:putative multicopper oxidase, type 1 [Teratosphaeria nubilosa]
MRLGAAFDPTSSTASSSTANSACTNGHSSRNCWSEGYSVDTDFDIEFPTTGNTVKYYWKITNGTCNPDGHGERICMLINDQYPGPLLRATWGDFIEVTVVNKMQDNGTGIHWHGVRQYHTPGQDGVPGLSECPIAPGKQKTYRFQATQFGSSWYHSHYSVQYGDGVVGPIIFDGPATANYNYDLGTYLLTDWYYQTAWAIDNLTSQNLQENQPPPPGDNILINGTNKNADGGGEYNQVTIQSGKRYRLRLVNVGEDNFIQVSLDGHRMEVIAADFVPTKPVTVETLVIGTGQRYDVIITANQTADNYWFRANASTACYSANNFQGLAIWSYESATKDTPHSTAWPQSSECAAPSPLEPYWPQAVPSGDFANLEKELEIGITKTQQVPGGDTLTVWELGNGSMSIVYTDPTMEYIMEGNSSYPEPYRVLPTMSLGGWNYWLIQQGPNVPPPAHPIHLHGHDFFILGQGDGQYNSSSPLNYETPTRRDTAIVGHEGWLALAFRSDNPGVWLMHCHIAWHISEGFGVQFVEAPEHINFPDRTQFHQECSDYQEYAKTAYYTKDNSGL